MKRFGIFEPLWMSFYSRELYRDVGRRWTGIGFLYLLVLLALSWLPITVRIQIESNKWIGEAAESLAKEIRSVRIQDGVVTVDPPGPHVFRDPQTGEPFFTIDASLEEVPDEIKEGIYLIRSKLILKKPNQTETRIYDLSGVKEFSVDQADIRRWAGYIRSLLAVAFFAVVLPFSYAYRILQALLYAAIGILFAQAQRAALDYRALLRLAVVAVTPAIILDTVLEFAGQTPRFWWVMCFAMAMGYLFFAVKASAEPEAAAGASAGSPPAG